MAEFTDFKIPELQPPKEYHVFITHCEEDLRVAKKLLEDLTSIGFKCMFAKRDFVPGAPVVENIANAITKCRRIVMVISKASLSSDWCNYEMLLALTNDVHVDRVSVIPLLLGDVTGTDLPYPLKYLTWVHAGEEPISYLQKLATAISAPDVSLKIKLPAGNVAHGLAWSYYFGYLKLVLPDISDSIMQSTFWNGDQRERNMCKKIILLFPQSCKCQNTLTEDDPDIRFEGHLSPVERNRAGTVGRRYKNTVYSVCDEQRRYYFVGEYITAIHTMYEMELSGKAGLSTSYKYVQATYFYLTVMDILKKDPMCMNKFSIIPYEDDNESPVISTLILRTIKEEIQNDIHQETLQEMNNEEIQQSLETDCSKSIQPNSCQSGNILEHVQENDESSKITNDFYNFILFDMPEEEPVVIRDETGKPKTIERGENITNFLTNPP